MEYADVKLVATCDRDSGKLDAAARAYGVETTYDDYQIMLDQEKMDGVTIATNYTSHYAITRDCLNHDLHVMVEKPMTVSAHDARRLVDLGGTWWRGRDDGRIVRMKSWRAANEN